MQTATTTNQEIQHLMRFFFSFIPEPSDLCTYVWMCACVFLMWSAPERWLYTINISLDAVWHEWSHRIYLKITLLCDLNNMQKPHKNTFILNQCVDSLFIQIWFFFSTVSKSRTLLHSWIFWSFSVHSIFRLVGMEKKYDISFCRHFLHNIC